MKEQNHKDFEHPDLDTPNFVRTDHLVTSVRVEKVGGHDVVTVWNRGGCAGSLTVDPGDGEPIARLLTRLYPVEEQPATPAAGDLGALAIERREELIRGDTRTLAADEFFERLGRPGPTPAAGEGVRERALAVLDFLDGSAPLDGRWFHEFRLAGAGPYWWRRYLAEIRAALLRTPSGEGPVIHIPDDAEYRDDGSVHWRVRVPVGAPSGEGEAEPDAYLVEFRHDDGQWGPVAVTDRHDYAQLHITSYGDRGRIVPLYRALRSEAPGEVEIDEAALEEARAVLEDVRDALEVLPPGILGEASEVVEASDGEVGVRSWMIRDELIDRINRALRSEWRIDEPAREIVRREMPDTRATVSEAIRAARRGEGGGHG